MTGTFAAQRDAGACATTADQAVTCERHRGVREAVKLLRAKDATRADAHQVILRSVERQARIAGCGRVHLEVSR